MTKTIMLVCAGGFSSSLLVKHMQDAAKDEGRDYTIFATSVYAATDEYPRRHPDVLLIGPQVRFESEKLTKALPIPVQVIDMHDYGTMNGPAVLAVAEELMGDK
ncbi:PTS sugar transporter subunit IIB [Lacticaseibacillus hulanensis]|uniref:PTS sugar transporter subunit IIB n=1 Tax=Lacticaseibacillus hulanensis TaxID=2493111 RepID=UPI000FDCB411|nr:PTS sugar transporter subunit IIB [Lacticaseibacillus hulanensis]